MKRLTGLILAVLVLCGCAVQTQDETTVFPTETTAEATLPTEPRGIYEPHSDLEIQTDGTVRSYAPQIPDCYGMCTVGSDVLIFSGLERTTLTRLTGDNLFTVASAKLECMVYPEDTTFQISSNGITYYDGASNSVVFLDHDLKEVSRLQMPAEMTGKPILSSNRMRVYYCTADAVRIHDLESGLDMLLRSVAYPEQSVEDILLNDTVLRCSMLDEQGTAYTVFLSTQTGELLGQVSGKIDITAEKDCFYAIVPEGSVNLILFGTDEETVLTPLNLNAPAWPLEERHGLVTVCSGQDRAVLDYYDLASGLRTASCELPGDPQIRYVQEDPNSGRIYLMGVDARSGEALLLSWQPEASAVADETIYTGARYTRNSPDTAGLAECRDYAASLSETYGIRILIGEEAAAERPWDYDLEVEYQVPVIRRELNKLEQYLSHFPEGFFRQFYGTPGICLVRSITGNAQSGSLEAASGIQFWQGEEEYVALAAGDALEHAFYHELFHIIDGKVLSDSARYYNWIRLNPTGFSYFEDYSSYLTADLSAYLQDETRAFIDSYSASFPKEDRARIMEYACTADNGHYFQSEIMQTKLKTLCQGIREAFHLELYPEPLLWEQYLNEPLTQ